MARGRSDDLLSPGNQRQAAALLQPASVRRPGGGDRAERRTSQVRQPATGRHAAAGRRVPISDVQTGMESGTVPPYVIRQAIRFLPCGFFLSSICLSSFFFPRLISAAAGWMSIPYFDTWCGPSANLECMSTCPHNMVNFGPLAAEIVSLVWGTPGNFNWFRILAALLHGTLVVGVSQTAALNRGRHLHSAGRPSRWALAHISSNYYY